MRKNNFFDTFFSQVKKVPMAIKLEGAGRGNWEALMILPLVEELFLQLPQVQSYADVQSIC